MYETFSLLNFFRKALSLSEKGTRDQHDDVVGLVAATSQVHGELDDIVSGVRDPKLHPHHDPKDLAKAADSGIRNLRKIVGEIAPDETLPEILPPVKK